MTLILNNGHPLCAIRYFTNLFSVFRIKVQNLWIRSQNYPIIFNRFCHNKIAMKIHITSMDLQRNDKVLVLPLASVQLVPASLFVRLENLST